MLANIFELTTFTSHQVVCFTAKNYPFNFFKLLFSFLKKQHHLSVSNLFVNSVSDWQLCKKSLEMSFLGQSSYYWFGELGVDGKTKQQIYNYLANYQGPHHILIFINSDESIPEGFGYKIDLNFKINKEFNSLIKLFPTTNHFRLIKFIKNIQDHLNMSFNLDQLCLLMQYGSLVRDLEEFDIKWIPQIINTEQSLFELSKYFLFRDSTAFYKSWATLNENYPEQFWISFFSEQLFKAYWFVIYQKSGDFKLSKQIGFRLPFDFMKTGWRYIDPNVLKSAHHELYVVDYQLKNGGSELWLETFLNKFLKS